MTPRHVPRPPVQGARVPPLHASLRRSVSSWQHCAIVTTHDSRRRPLLQERSGQTKTWHLIQDDERSIPDDPVLSLLWADRGVVFYLDDHRYEEQPRRWLAMGSDETRDLVLADERVSSLHCFLLRDHKSRRVYIEDANSKNGTLINGRRVADGFEPLHSGMWLTLGGVDLLACGRAGAKQDPFVAGVGLQACIEETIPRFGTRRKAASALNIPLATFLRWLDRKKFVKRR